MTARIQAKTEFLMPRIGLGTWQLEGDGAIAAVNAALEAGYEHIDTASRYENEAAIGRAVAASGVPRSKIFLTSKVWWNDLQPQKLRDSIARSIDALGSGYLDLALIHWPNPAVPLQETLDALAEAKARGHVKRIGVSNFPSVLLERALEVSAEPIAALQCEYHPYIDQTRLLDLCDRNDIAFIAYAPFGSGGVLADPVITRIAQTHSTTPGDVVLQWLMQQGVCAVPRSSNPQRIAANLRRDTFSLSSAEMEKVASLRRPDGRIFSPEWAPRWDT